jgi:hypothetical protein
VKGVKGKESFSSPSQISETEGVCPPPMKNMMGAEPYVSQLHFTGKNSFSFKFIIFFFVIEMKA